MKESEFPQLNVRINPTLFEMLRVQSFNQKTTKKNIVEEALKLYFTAKMANK